jgi:uncharacterized protein (TIGR00251 family)
MEKCLRLSGDLLLLDIKAQPGASRSALGAPREGRLRVKIAAPPEDGKANRELIAFFARALGCPKRDITLAGGDRSRLKTLAFPLIYREKIEILIANTNNGE